MLSYGADVNSMADARHDYRTVLHYAILGGDPTVIDLLLKQGARLDLGPEYQKPTALDLAILKGDPSIVRMLLESGEFSSFPGPSRPRWKPRQLFHFVFRRRRERYLADHRFTASRRLRG